ncbi:hypothetical protein ACN38_g3014 [Penicillium nordicum]|uniref:Uncharacterized protein n=1 Tax=Penicillium nordicum TaxID=229535 RepID=A0A0M9WIG2_9EURO|nr:hypothetical protein ACN38_g3014 [Penicillium nordicum]
MPRHSRVNTSGLWTQGRTLREPHGLFFFFFFFFPLSLLNNLNCSHPLFENPPHHIPSPPTKKKKIQHI